MSDAVKISYNAALYRVRCEVTRAACMASDMPPPDLVARARAKLESVKSGGEISFFVIFETRLLDVWKAMRLAPDLEPDYKVGFTLGAGAPTLNGIRIERGTGDKALALISIDAATAGAATWRWEWFKLNVWKRLREAGIKDTPNWAQLYAVYTRAAEGEPVEGVALGPLSAVNAAGSTKPYSVIANKQRLEIGVVVRKVSELADKNTRESLFVLLSQAVRQMSVNGVTFRLLKKDFLTAIQGALSGPESLDVDMPLVILAAIGKGPVQAAARPGTRSAPVPGKYPGAGLLTFTVSQDRMEAAIGGFKLSFYDDPSFEVTIEWIQNELKRNLLRMPMAEEIIKSVSDAIVAKADLNGVLVLRGDAGSGGKGPILHPSYRDAATRSTANLDQDELDIRELQQRQTVKAGQLVAEIRYTTPPREGRDVYGEALPPPPPDEMIVRVGEGIQQREPGRFYAATDGMPAMDGESIALLKQLVHEGDVNLRSGNIHFDGPVEIKGSIDNGAVVECSGDLIVHGTIQGALVRVGGSVTVKEGIVTGAKGRIQARGNLTAEFIENSNITCGGDLKVTRALINSNVIVGGVLRTLAKGSVVAGGSVITKGGLYTHNLGFKRGAVTRLMLGVDWRIARALDIRQKRLTVLQTRNQDDRQALRELVQKSRAQMTARHKEMKDQLQQRLTRLRTMIERMETRVQQATAQMTFNTGVRAFVEEQLVANIDLQIAGQPVAVVNDVFNVAVLPKRRRGSYVVPLEEVQAEDRANGVDGKRAG